MNYENAKKLWDGDTSSSSPYFIARQNGASHKESVIKTVSTFSDIKYNSWFNKSPIQIQTVTDLVFDLIEYNKTGECFNADSVETELMSRGV